MISCYTGTPGSGKSLHVAQKIYWRLKFGHPTICNFEINIPKKSTRARFQFVDNWELTPDMLISYSRELYGEKRPKEGSILLVIDEAQLLFSCREWKGSQRAKWTSFFTQHRKFGYDIILICQFIGMLDKQLRSIVEYEEIHRKLTNMGWRGWFLSALLLSPHMFVSVRVWATLRERLSAEFFRYSRKYGKLYDTYTEFKDPKDAVKARLIPQQQPDAAQATTETATASSSAGEIKTYRLASSGAATSLPSCQPDALD